MAKRYVLYLADADLGAAEVEELGRILEGRHGRLKVIEVKGNRRAVIIRTTVGAATEMRERSGSISLREKRVAGVLTSGVIGKLKKRAAESATTRSGKVP
jgi:hypothetical protein